jgi:hypothetical protein
MDLFPINELVRKTAQDSGLSARPILDKMGYKNFNKGKRYFDAIVAHNSVNKDTKAFRQKYFETFLVPLSDVESARAATQKLLLEIASRAAEQKDEKRETMDLEAVFAEKPSGLHGHMYQYALSKIFNFRRSANPEAYLKLIKAIIIQRQISGVTKNGPYGETVGYRLQLSSFERWIFDMNGSLTGKQSIIPGIHPTLDF